MRRFRVWLDVQVPGKAPEQELVEMPDSATDEECEAECKDCLYKMISNEIDTYGMTADGEFTARKVGQ